MYSYQVIWHTENNNSDTGEIEHEAETIPIIHQSKSKEGRYEVIKITFSPIPDFEIYARAVFNILDGNNNIILTNSFDVYDDGNVEIHEPSSTYSKVSLEECTLIDDELNCEIYWN